MDPNQIEKRKNRRYVIVEDFSKIIKDLKSGEIVVDLSLSGAKIVSLDQKRIGETIDFTIDLPKSLGSLELKGKNIRSKILKIDKLNLYETGIEFEGLNQIDSTTLGRFIGHLEKEKILFEGRAKIKALLNATRKLKKNVLVLKCSLTPKKDSDTTN